MKFISAFLLLLLLSAPDNSHAAISFDNSTNAVVTNNNSLSWRHNIGIGANRKLIVGIGIEEDDSSGHDVITGVTYNGVNLTFAGQTSISSTGYLQRVEVWYMDEANLPNGNRWIQVNTTGNVREISAGAISLFDAEQGVPAFQASSSNISQTSISTNITTTVDNSWVVDVVGSGQPFTFAPGAGQTERWDSDQSIGNWTSSAASSTKIVTTAGVTTMTQNQNSNRMAHVVLAIKPFGVAPPVLPAVVGEWRMDELSWNGSAGEVIDSSVNGLNGVRAGSATPTAAKLCNGATLNGTTDYVEIADNALLDISDELTVAAWIKPDAIPGSGLKTIISKDENFEFHLTNTAEINWWWNNSAGATRSITTSGASITAGNWYHVAIVYSQTGGSQKIYINGIERASATYSEALRLNNDPLQIGADQGAAGRQFDGQIDEVRIYASMLTAGNVAQVMAETRTCPGVTTPTPIVLSTAGTATLGGTTFENEDAVAFTSTATTIPFDGSTIFAGNENIDAFHFIDSDNVLLSTTGNASIGTTSFRDEDVVQYTFSTGVATIIFDGSTIFSGNEDIDAVYQIDADTILISTMEPAAIGGNNYQDNVMIQYTLSTGANSEFFDLQNYTAGGSDIDGFHILPNGNYLVSTDNTETIGALTFEDEDVIELDIGTPGVTLYFDGDANYSADEETDAVSLIVPTVSLDHFAINYLSGATGTGVTCQAEALTIEAHDASHNLITTYTGTVTLGTSTANGDWSKTGTASDAFGTLTAGASDSGTATYTFNATDSGSIILNFKDTHTEIVNLNTVDSLISETSNSAVANDDFEITFSDSGFIYTIPTQTSCAISSSITIQAVRLDATTQTCVPAFQNKDRNLKVWASYNDPAPAAIVGTPAVTLVNGNGSYVLPSTEPGATNVNMSFAGSADETFTVAYPDAGQLTLNMKYEGSVANSDTGLTMLGNNTFVVKPHSFYLQGYYDNAGADVNLNNATSSGNPTWRASDNFRLRLRGQCSNNTITKNYVPTNAELFVELALPDQTVPGNHANLTIQGDDFVSSYPAPSSPTWHPISSKFYHGAITNVVSPAATDQSNYSVAAFHEVGVLNLHVRDTNYFGETIAEQTQAIGRFTPHHFDTEVTQGCNTFTYSSQPFRTKATAMNNLSSPSITLNYNGDFAKNTAISNSGTTTLFANNVIQGGPVASGGQFINGEGQTEIISSINAITYTFANKDTPPSIINLRAIDADTISSATFTEASTTVQSGRARLENVFGSELSSLTMPLNIEYYSDNATPLDLTDDGFLLNTNDTCTSYDATAGALTNYTGNLSTGETTVTGAVVESNGLSNISFSAPGAGNEGSVNLLANNISSWLTYSWNVDCDNADGDDDITTGIDAGLCGPYGKASFGLYRGDDRIIYWREVFQ